MIKKKIPKHQYIILDIKTDLDKLIDFEVITVLINLRIMREYLPCNELIREGDIFDTVIITPSTKKERDKREGKVYIVGERAWDGNDNNYRIIKVNKRFFNKLFK